MSCIDIHLHKFFTQKQIKPLSGTCVCAGNKCKKCKIMRDSFHRYNLCLLGNIILCMRCNDI